MTQDPKPSKTTRKLTIYDVEAIAKAVAELKLTETEACEHLGYKVNAWWKFKSRGKISGRFDQLITRIRASRISNCINKINDIGDGIGVKQPDWRAKQFILQITDPRYVIQTQAGAPQVTNNNFQLIVETVNRMYASVESNDGQPMKQLNAANEPEPKLIQSAIKRVSIPTRRP